MASWVDPAASGRLERLCGPSASDWLRIAPLCPGLERVEAFFSRNGFDPHRHDTYAIGITVHGVQSFRYRGAAERSTPGRVFVLHPDELHDGHAGTAAGFRYRILYVDPRLILEALGDAPCPLPFVRQPVSSDPRLTAAIIPALADLETPLEDLQRDQIVVDLAGALAAADPSLPRRKLLAVHLRAAHLARDFLEARPGPVLSRELEAITGLTRFALARPFRACLGTSPYRYLVLRRLDRARALIRQGSPLADAALASGFADQSHMTRQFKAAYGVSPGRWARLSA